MARRPTLEDWRAKLEGQGHRIIEPTWETTTGFTLCLDADKTVTIGVELDQALNRKYRQRYFITEAERDPEEVLRITGCQAPHRSRWLELVSQQPPSDWQDYLAGPGSWLLSRLARFREVVAWSDHGLPWSVLDDPMHRGWGMVVPSRAVSLFPASPSPDASQPCLLTVDDDRFTDAVAACVLFASVGNRDCYLADLDATEVYRIDDDDVIFVSIPARTGREALQRELRKSPLVFRDVSEHGSR